MKKTAFILIMTLTAMTTVAFGSQTSNVERAKTERSCAFERAEYERIHAAEQEKYARQYIKLLFPEYRQAAPEKKASAASEKKTGVAKVWVSGHWKDVKVGKDVKAKALECDGGEGNVRVVRMQKKTLPRNVLSRGASSGPAVRRK